MPLFAFIFFTNENPSVLKQLYLSLSPGIRVKVKSGTVKPKDPRSLHCLLWDRALPPRRTPPAT